MCPRGEMLFTLAETSLQGINPERRCEELFAMTLWFTSIDPGYI